METDHDNNIAILSKTVFKKASNRHHSSPNIQKTCALIFCGVGEQNLPLGQTLKYCKACHLVTYCVCTYHPGPGNTHAKDLTFVDTVPRPPETGLEEP